MLWHAFHMEYIRNHMLEKKWNAKAYDMLWLHDRLLVEHMQHPWTFQHRSINDVNSFDAFPEIFTYKETFVN